MLGSDFGARKLQALPAGRQGVRSPEADDAGAGRKNMADIKKQPFRVIFVLRVLSGGISGGRRCFSLSGLFSRLYPGIGRPREAFRRLSSGLWRRRVFYIP